MPRVNLCKDLKKEKEADMVLIEVMLKYRNRAGITRWDQAAPLCGFNKNTFTKRRKNPETFTRREIRQVVRGLNIPDEEIRPYL